MALQPPISIRRYASETSNEVVEERTFETVAEFTLWIDTFEHVSFETDLGHSTIDVLCGHVTFGDPHPEKV